MGIEFEKFVTAVDEHFICSICTLVLENPIKISGCEHMFCRLCIEHWLKQNATCPVDRRMIDRSVDLISPDRTVISMLNNLKMKCEFESLGCFQVIQFESWKKHLINCDFNPENKWPCVGCEKMLTKKEENSHKCVEVLEIEIIKLKQVTDDLISSNQKFREEIQKLKRENNEKSTLIKQLVDENEENQMKNKLLLNKNDDSELLPSTSLSTNPNNLTNNLVVKSKLQASATWSIDKWPILNQLPHNLKNQVRLASVLKNNSDYTALIITKNDKTFWIKAKKTIVEGKNSFKLIKINSLSGLMIKSLKLSFGIESTLNVMAVTEDGKLLTWSNWKNSKENFGRNEFNKPTFVSLAGKNVIKIACGKQHTLALTSDGEVFAWGDNGYGQLGMGTTTTLKKPMRVTAAIRSFWVVAVACCATSSYAIIDNGDVFAWGNNELGQLGIGNEENQALATRIEALAGIKIKRLACGWTHVLALADDGSMFAWGWNSNGQLGTGDTKNRNKPVKVRPSWVKFIEVAACNSFNCLSVALSEDGRCWVWGRCKTRPEFEKTENVLTPTPVDSKSINDAIAEYAKYQTTWNTMVICQ